MEIILKTNKNQHIKNKFVKISKETYKENLIINNKVRE